MSDGWRLAVGTWSVLPTKPPQDVNHKTAATAMLLGPLMGAFVGISGAAVGSAVWLVDRQRTSLNVLAAIAVVATWALLTRALHLDGLADTADGFGSAKSGPAALAIMKRSDIGPFGVVTLVFVLLTQIVSASALVHVRGGLAFIVSAAVVARLCALAVTTKGWQAARTDGLGATVIGVVPRVPAIVEWLVIAALIVGLSHLMSPAASIAAAVGILLALATTFAVAGLATKRFGGLTGDTLGAIVELGATCVLVAGAIGIGR
jgi:adenosylcobinamide-GDP ribazoletransferase